jgi:hypothetical protein
MLKRKCIAGAFLMFAPAILWADDLTGSNRFVCTSWHAARCTADGICESAPPWKLNIPDFVRLDLGAKVIATTAASSEDRTTHIEGAQRANGVIVLHGQQGERAWSWVINEASGEGTLTISSQGDGVTIFSACTPIERLEKAQ